MAKKNDVITAKCGICGLDSFYDAETLKASTHIINGCSIVICCPCEDSLRELFEK